MSLFTKMFGTYSQRQLKKLEAVADYIDSLGEKYAAILRENGVSATAYPSSDSAIERALADAKSTGKVLVCLGSLYTYADVVKAIEKQK